MSWWGWLLMIAVNVGDGADAGGGGMGCVPPTLMRVLGWIGAGLLLLVVLILMSGVVPDRPQDWPERQVIVSP